MSSWLRRSRAAAASASLIGIVFSVERAVEATAEPIFPTGIFSAALVMPCGPWVAWMMYRRVHTTWSVHSLRIAACRFRYGEADGGGGVRLEGGRAMVFPWAHPQNN